MFAQRPKGTRDFNAEEMAKRRCVEKIMRDVCELFGYREICTPTFEYAEIFIKKSGKAITKQMYAFKDKSRRYIALRPELTVPVMRFYANSLQSQPKPLKLFYFGNCFRYEEPQKARYREFWQLSIECIGGEESESEAEVIALGTRIIESTGLKNFSLRIGNLKILKSLLDDCKIPCKEQSLILTLIDKKDFKSLKKKIGKNYKKIAEVLSQGEKIFENKSLLKNKNIAQAASEFKTLLAYLENFGVKNYVVDLGIARGLEYYTGTVFEIDSPELGAEKQICGGGTYNLSEIFGYKGINTTGFAIGFDRVMLALENQAMKIPPKRLTAYIVPVGEDKIIKKKAFELTTLLRKNNIMCDVDLAGRNITKNLYYADSIKAKNAVLLGEDELKENCVLVRDMDTGNQDRVNINTLVEYFMRREQ